MTKQADIGLIGLAVMGQNLVLNMDDHGYTVAVYNRTTSKVDRFIENEANGTKVIGAHSLEELVGDLKRPRRVMIMVKAGWPVDATIEQLVPLLEPGDIIIDGGNSHYPDSTRRTNELSREGYFVYRHRCFRRGRRRTLWAVDHAWGLPWGLATCQTHFSRILRPKWQMVRLAVIG